MLFDQERKEQEEQDQWNRAGAEISESNLQKTKMKVKDGTVVRKGLVMGKEKKAPPG